MRRGKERNEEIDRWRSEKGIAYTVSRGEGGQGGGRRFIGEEVLHPGTGSGTGLGVSQLAPRAFSAWSHRVPGLWLPSKLVKAPRIRRAGHLNSVVSPMARHGRR